jgi:glycogen(starch) synthase
MHALHVVQGYYPWIGGSQRFFQEVSERLVAAGHRVTVATTDAGYLEHFWARGRRTVGPAAEVLNGVQVYRFPVHRRLHHALLFSIYRRGMAMLSALPVDTTPLLRRLARFTPYLPDFEVFLKEEGKSFDLVHGANITLDFMLAPAMELAQERSLPFVITPLTHPGAPGQKRVQRYYTMRQQLAILHQADAVITLTPLEADFLAARGVPRGRCFSTGAGVNLAEVTGGDGARFRQRHGLSGPIVFSIGTLAYDKGTVHLIEALRRLWAAGREAHLVLAGQPLTPVRAYLDRLPAEVASRLHVLGFVSDEEKRDLLAAGDVFCLPSCTDSYGIVYLEAWANGVPVIGARAGGVPAVIADGRDGYLVDFGDVSGLAGAIGRLLDVPALRREMGQRGQDKVRREMTWDHVFQRVEQVYKVVMDGRYP